MIGGQLERLILKTLLIIFHSPSENTQRMADTMVKAANKYKSEDLNIILKSPFDAHENDVLACDAIILGTTENLGYMAGALKDFFDRVYYPCLEVKQGLPVAVVIRAGHDGTGTKRALETILTGLRWRWVQEPMICKGPWQETFITDVSDLSEGMALSLQQGII